MAKNLKSLLEDPKRIEEAIIKSNDLNVEIEEKIEEEEESNTDDKEEKRKTTGKDKERKKSRNDGIEEEGRKREPNVTLIIKERQHRLLKLYCAITGKYLNRLVEEIIEGFIEEEGVEDVERIIEKAKKKRD